VRRSTERRLGGGAPKSLAYFGEGGGNSPLNSHCKQAKLANLTVLTTRLSLCVSLAILLAFVEPALARASKQQSSLLLRCERLTVDDEGWVISSGRVELPHCRLRAKRIQHRRGQLHAQHIRLIGPNGAGLLSAAALRFDNDLQLVLRTVRMRLCGPLSVSASRIRRRSTSNRLHLSWPVAWVGSVPVAALPYLSLPLESGLSGLLIPAIGVGGDGEVRLTLPVFIGMGAAGLTLAGTWTSQRGFGGQSALGVDFGQNGAGQIALVFGGHRAPGALLRSNAWISLGSATLSVQAQYFSAASLLEGVALAPQWLFDMAQAPRWIFAPYLRTRGLLSMDLGPLSARLAADLFSQKASDSEHHALRWVASMVLAPISLWGPFYAMGSLDVGWSDRLASGPTSRNSPRQAEYLRMSASLAAAQRVGWFALTGAFSVRRESRAGLDVVQALDGRGALGLPLRRRLAGGWSHDLEPWLGWRSIAWGDCAACEHRDASHIIVGGVKSELRNRRGTSSLRTDISLFYGSERLVSADLEARYARRLMLSGRLVQPFSGQPLHLALQASLIGDGQMLGVGYLRDRGELSARIMVASVEPWSALDPRRAFLIPDPSDPAVMRFGAAFAKARFTLAQQLDLRAQIVLDLTENKASYGVLGLDWRTSCFAVRVSGMFRRGQPLPDVIAQIDLGRLDAPKRAGRCLAFRR
jgi:hypothetical protein